MQIFVFFDAVFFNLKKSTFLFSTLFLPLLLVCLLSHLRIWTSGPEDLHLRFLSLILLALSYVYISLSLKWSLQSVENELAINVWIYFWALNSLLLMYMCILMPVPNCLNIVALQEVLKLRSVRPPRFLLCQPCFGYLESLINLYSYKYSFEFLDQLVHFYKKGSWISDEDFIRSANLGILPS